MSGDSPAIELSVLIASHNRVETLRRCLQALGEQTEDTSRFEVVVADDGSTDGTAAVLATLETQFSLRCLELSKGGQPAALNAAIAAARGEVCLFIDDDVIASPGLVAAHLAAHRLEPNTLGIGPLTQRPPSEADAYARAYARRWNARNGALLDSGADWADTYGGNFSAPRAALREVGGYDTEIGTSQDIEIAFRLQRHGCTPRFLPAAEALHDDYKSGARILVDEERFGRFCAEFVAAHPDTRERLVGWIDTPGRNEVMLRRSLLRLGVASHSLIRIGALLPTDSARARWYDFVSRYTFWRGVKRGVTSAAWRDTVGGVPVLMYHAFSDGGERDRFVISAATFDRQMRLLKALRYRFISLPELAEALRTEKALPRRTVVVTIDDGYRDVYEVAFPILRRHRINATVYLVTRKLGGRNDWGDSGAVGGRQILDPRQIEEMRAAGVRFGAHTRGHRRLPELAAEELDAEVSGSRADAEAELGEPVPDFTYPYGQFDDAAVEAVARAGFTAAATTVPRRARRGDHPLRIPRIEVMGSDTTRSFLRKLWIGGM